MAQIASMFEPKLGSQEKPEHKMQVAAFSSRVCDDPSDDCDLVDLGERLPDVLILTERRARLL